MLNNCEINAAGFILFASLSFNKEFSIARAKNKNLKCFNNCEINAAGFILFVSISFNKEFAMQIRL